VTGPEASETPAHALERLAGEEYCYLTTTGRVSGRPHEIEIWFGASSGVLYMMSGGGKRADWVKNLLKEPRVSVRIAGLRFAGRARLVTDSDEEQRVRNLLATKYDEREPDGELDEWARTALPVAVDVEGLE
jgi:deazaflavin-dependent oxidoreductase (nitroreductase family)